MTSGNDDDRKPTTRVLPGLGAPYQPEARTNPTGRIISPGNVPRRFGVGGIAKLAEGERGLILPWRIEIEGNSFSATGNTLPQDFRVATLFWDKIARPHSNVFAFRYNSAEDDFLRAQGMLCEPVVNFMDGLGPGDTERIFYNTLEAANHFDPGRWSVYTGSGGLSVIAASPEARDLVFELHRALPVPDRDVPLEDVLKFKERRRDELAELRLSLHEIQRAIADDPKRDLREQMERARMGRALADFGKVSDEARFRKRLISLSGKIGLSSAKGMPAGYGAAVALGLPGGLGAIAGGALAQLSIDVGSLFSARSAPGPYEYVGRYHDELY